MDTDTSNQGDITGTSGVAVDSSPASTPASASEVSAPPSDTGASNAGGGVQPNGSAPAWKAEDWIPRNRYNEISGKLRETEKTYQQKLAEREQKLAAYEERIKRLEEQPPAWLQQFAPKPPPEKEPEFSDPLERDFYRYRKEAEQRETDLRKQIEAIQGRFEEHSKGIELWRTQQEQAAALARVQQQYATEFSEAVKKDPSIQQVEAEIAQIWGALPDGYTIQDAVAIYRARFPTPPAPVSAPASPVSGAQVSGAQAAKPKPPGALRSNPSNLIEPRPKPSSLAEVSAGLMADLTAGRL